MKSEVFVLFAHSWCIAIVYLHIIFEQLVYFIISSIARCLQHWCACTGGLFQRIPDIIRMEKKTHLSKIRKSLTPNIANNSVSAKVPPGTLLYDMRDRHSLREWRHCWARDRARDSAVPAFARCELWYEFFLLAANYTQQWSQFALT